MAGHLPGHIFCSVDDIARETHVNGIDVRR
jgi:hypothetical protein